MVLAGLVFAFFLGDKEAVNEDFTKGRDQSAVRVDDLALKVRITTRSRLITMVNR